MFPLWIKVGSECCPCVIDCFVAIPSVAVVCVLSLVDLEVALYQLLLDLHLPSSPPLPLPPPPLAHTLLSPAYPCGALSSLQ